MPVFSESVSHPVAVGAGSLVSQGDILLRFDGFNGRNQPLGSEDVCGERCQDMLPLPVCGCGGHDFLSMFFLRKTHTELTVDS